MPLRFKASLLIQIQNQTVFSQTAVGNIRSVLPDS